MDIASRGFFFFFFFSFFFTKPTNQFLMFNKVFSLVEKSLSFFFFLFFSLFFSFFGALLTLILVFMTVFQQHFQAMFYCYSVYKILLDRVIRHNKRNVAK